MKTKCILILVLSLTFHFGFTQSLQELDSLLKVLPNDKEDTIKVRHLIFISEDYCLIDFEKSLEYAKKALELSKKIKWQKGMASSYFRIAHANFSLGNYKMGLEYKLKELKKWKMLDYKLGICSSMGEIGIYYSELGDNKKAMEYYIYSLKLAEKLKYRQLIMRNLCNIAAIYEDEDDYENAMLYYKKSLKISEIDKDSLMIANNQTNIGNLYSDKGNFQKALSSLSIAREIYKNFNDMNHYAIASANIGYVYMKQGDIEEKQGDFKKSKEKKKEALKYFEEALSITENLGSDHYMTSINGNIGAIYINEKKYDIAEKYLIKALVKAREKGLTNEIYSNYQRLSKLYKEKKDFSKALEYYEMYTVKKDSVYNEEKYKAVSELKIKYEVEKKEDRNIELEKQNDLQNQILEKNYYIKIGLGIIIVFLFFFLLILFYLNRLKAHKITSVFKQKLLRLQMNPHFLFNSLANIESFIYEHQPKEAGEYLTKFSRLIRNILENSESEFITLDKEIETLECYLALEKLRLNDNLEYTITIEDNLKTDQTNFPPMLAQPFIENAIEHGFKGGEKFGKIEISFSRKKDNIIFEIKDNGVGINSSIKKEEKKKNSKPLAMQITKERIFLLNKSRKKKTTFVVNDLLDNSENKHGTHVIFSIPIV